MADAALTAIEVGGFRGSYTAEGAGRVVVLLVSPFARAAVYSPTVAALLRERFRVIVVEMPGCGVGSRVTRWGLEECAAWVAAFLEAMALGDVTLIGHSHSGAVAMLVAAGDAGGRVSRVVLADAVGAEASRSFLGVFIGCAMCVPLELRFALRVVPAALGNLRRHGGNFARQFFLSVRAEMSAAARRVGVPVLLAWGAMDYVEPPECARQLGRWLPRSTLYVSRRGSHDWLITRPGEFAGAVAGFVGENAER